VDHKPKNAENRDPQSDFPRPPIEAKKSRWGFRGMTVREWLELLIVPVVLALITVVFTWQQNERQQDLETKRTKQAQNIENQRAEAEQDLAKQRAQDEALQAYLGQMSQLLLEKDLLGSKEGSVEWTLARARTFTVMQRLDAERNKTVVRFLGESKLIETDGTTPSLLKGASLDHANLAGVDLSHADLSGANLEHANLENAYFAGANLDNANLDNANLEGAYSYGDASMKWASFDHANMHNFYTLPHLNLSWAHLWDTNLSGAYLEGANLSNANLDSANLSNAELDSANLRGAAHVTQKQLDSSKSLLDATMPNGEKWLKEKDYVTDEFEPAFRLEFGEAGWAWKVSRQTADEVHVRYVPELEAELLFTSPLHVFDLSDPSTYPSKPKELPAPETVHEWVSWFQSHPNLETSNPVPESVGGVSGMRIDVTCVPWPRDASLRQILPCSPPFPIRAGSSGTQGAEVKDRYIIVDVRGETVLIDVATETEGKFDEFLPKAQKVLDSVEWKGG
jgi:hypothetical protein